VASKFIAWSDKKISEESFSPMIMEGAFVAFGSEAIVGRNCIIARACICQFGRKISELHLAYLISASLI
jgi:hypothetical protein